MTRHGLRIGVLVLEMRNDLRVVLVPQPLERVDDPVAVVHAFVLDVFGDDRLDGVHTGTVADTPRPPAQLRQAGPRRAFRSPNKSGDAVTRKESSSRMSTERPGWVSLRWTSVTPGCSPSTLLIRSATPLVALANGRVTTTGPRGPSLMSGSVSSWAKIVGVSSRRFSRPRTTHTTSWPSMVETVMYADGKKRHSIAPSRSSTVAIAQRSPFLVRLIRRPVIRPARDTLIVCSVRSSGVSHAIVLWACSAR